MSSSEIVDHMALAKSVCITENELVVGLSDGRTISVPIDWYPRLQAATQSERMDVRLIGNGVGIHWPKVDEDISVQAILEGKGSSESKASFKKWLAGRK